MAEKGPTEVVRFPERPILGDVPLVVVGGPPCCLCQVVVLRLEASVPEGLG